jgi:hypothetical protein
MAARASRILPRQGQRLKAEQRSRTKKLPPDTGATPMNLKEIIRHAVYRSIRNGGNRQGDTLKIELPAVELIADEIAGEVMDVIGMYTHNGGEE